MTNGRIERWTLVAVVLGSGIVFLDSTIVPVALPKIGEELSSTFLGKLEGQSYVYYGYLLSLSALLILAGALADYYGRRKLFVIGLIGFGATSILCGIAPNMETLVAARVLQGAAGAILVPGSLSIITSVFHGERQARAFGTWAGASAATTILGPVVGGALVASISWRAAFLINIPLVLWALWATKRYVPETRDENASGKFHWLGAVIVALAVGGLAFGAIRGEVQQWEGATPYVSLAIGALALIAFPFVMKASDHPLVPLELFKSRNFTVTNISTLLIYGAIYVAFQFLALFTIGVLGYTEIGYGVATVPSSLLLALFSTRFGVLAEKYGPRIFMTVGPALMGLGLLWLVRVPAGSDPWRFDLGDTSTWLPPNSYLVDVLPAQIVFGAGLAIMVAPLTTALMRSIPEARAGVASAFNNAISRVGPQLAGAILVIAISGSFYAALAERVPQAEVTSDEFREEVVPLNPVDESVPPEVKEAAREANAEAFHVAMAVAASLCFVGALVNGVGIRNPKPREQGGPEGQPAAVA